MTTPAQQLPRPGKRGYVVAGVMLAVALAIVTVVAVLIGRALVGYSVEPFAADQPVPVTLGDRGEAVWVAPASAAATCQALDQDQQSSITRGTADTMTITDGGREWARVGIVEGPPGSEHSVVCTSASGAESFGHAPNPRVARWVVTGVAGGLSAGLLGVGGLVVLIVVAVKRSRRRPA